MDQISCQRSHSGFSRDYSCADIFKNYKNMVDGVQFFSVA